MAKDTEMPDAEAKEEEDEMYKLITSEEFEKYPNRPHNLHKTLAFHSLPQTLFNPLEAIRKKKGTQGVKRPRTINGTQKTVSEQRTDIIDNYMNTWRQRVGNDFYPALRLMVPDQDRDRAMYGLKEKTIAKLLVRVIGINKTSDDATSLTNWKLPRASQSAGDFAARCYEVLSKRPLRTKYGDMTVGEVNIKLDELSLASKEDDQFPIFQEFYQKMNAEELMWLIRMILRQMKVGATEKTLFHRWHKDADVLFNVSSSLRRVCWELWDPNISLGADGSRITLMECFQPQLAAFQLHSFDMIVKKMDVSEGGNFWIEEKLDGERMQMHMQQNSSGEYEFKFWSRKAKDYTYLYGKSLGDSMGSLTKFLKNAFDVRVRSIILDGEMISWNMSEDKVQPFGNLKTAALAQQDTHSDGVMYRPVYRVFDCLYLNGNPLTEQTLEKRREALTKSVKPVHRRLEIHEVTPGSNAQEIEDKLREMVATSSEGLVVKNPKSTYRLNDRNEDWIKVKPEYMAEFGEELDVLIIGGYYGSGSRGGALSSFLCGLRLDQKYLALDPMGSKAQAEKCWSFCKVGGGFAAHDYKEIAEATEGKWHDWDSKKPPREYMELGGSRVQQMYGMLNLDPLRHSLPKDAIERLQGNLKDQELERPDVWIKPSESVVVSVKAASLSVSKMFRVTQTLRFPRFRALRTDKSWDQALSVEELFVLNRKADQERKEHTMELDEVRKQAKKTRAGAGRKRKKPLIIAGTESTGQQKNLGTSSIFEGLTFFAASAWTAGKKSKAEVEAAIKAHGGSIVQSRNAIVNSGDEDTKSRFLVISDAGTLPARSVQKEGRMNIVRPAWVFDCIALYEKQLEDDETQSQDMEIESFLLPFEMERHLFFVKEEDTGKFEGNVDDYGDSYCRDVEPGELKKLFSKMKVGKNDANGGIPSEASRQVLNRMQEDGIEVDELPGNMFRHCIVYFDKHADDASFHRAESLVKFAGGKILSSEADLDAATQIVVSKRPDKARLEELRKSIAKFQKVPRIVTLDWALNSWKEGTLLDEIRFTP